MVEATLKLSHDFRSSRESDEVRLLCCIEHDFAEEYGI
jgi:hypothetical protein